MQRLIARLMLLLAVAGTFLPVALQAAVSPVHACCRRSGDHRCHNAAPGSRQSSMRRPGCCERGGGRAVITAHWANPQAGAVAEFTPQLSLRGVQTSAEAPVAGLVDSRSARAPPRVDILS